MVAIRQELRPAVTVLQLGGIQFRHLRGCSAAAGDFVQRSVEGGRKKDNTFAVPASAAPVQRIAQYLCWSSRRFDRFEFAFGKEPDEPAVRRPEGERRVHTSRDRLTGRGVEWTQPQHLLSIWTERRKHQPRAIRRNHDRTGMVPDK